ncbi:YtxH domain-containing protein [Bacillus timonensis]|nr:YtxH domain-containing protein [Bacillus timonensis]
MKRNKMLEGMMFGAIVGAAVALFDKETRETVIHNSKSCGKKAIDVMKNPEVVTEKIKHNINTVRTTIEEVTEDVKFLASKVSEINETTPKMVEMLKETKQTFSTKRELEEDKEIEVK